MANHKFSSDIVMKVTLEQFNTDLKEPLRQLGHSFRVSNLEDKPYLCTNGACNNGELRNYSINSYDSSRYLIKTYIPKLFLALAAMTVGDTPIIGEHVIMENSGGWGYHPDNNGCIAVVSQVSSNQRLEGTILNPIFKDRLTFNIVPLHTTRKTTKEELIAHFSQGSVPVEEVKVSEFKKGTYIVFTEGTNSNFNSFPLFYVFKQRMSGTILHSCKDLKGSITNGWAMRPFQSTSDIKSSWRYATPEEIAEYDRLDKPFDVRNLNKQEESSWSNFTTDLKVGDKVIVTERYEENEAKVGCKGVIKKIEKNTNIPYLISSRDFGSSWCKNVRKDVEIIFETPQTSRENIRGDWIMGIDPCIKEPALESKLPQIKLRTTLEENPQELRLKL
jgi:hypothetical protein